MILREFILGSNQTGLVTNSSGAVSVIGGESSSLAADVFPGQSGIYVGQGATQSTYTFPSATIAAWESFIATASAGQLSSSESHTSGTVGLTSSAVVVALCTLSIVLRWLELY